MRLLLHTCCGPCLLYPLSLSRDKGFSVTPYFFNPNIHPYKEFRRRLDSLLDFSRTDKVPLIADEEYLLQYFLENVVNRKKERCSICYDLRLEKTVIMAKTQGFDSFSTTLLYSRYQNHALIKCKCESLAKKHDIHFFYHDFREGWQRGIDSSIEKNLYRQPYCGCIYSEQERYDKSLRRKPSLRKVKKGENIDYYSSCHEQ